MRLICDVCSLSGEGVQEEVSFSRYEDWTVHLLSVDHEMEMKTKLVDRVRHEDDAAFVVIFSKSREGKVPSRLETFEFFARKGFMAQYYYDESGRFGVVRVDSMFDGFEALSEGQCMINDLHLVTCLKAKEASDAFWKCLRDGKTTSLPQVVCDLEGDINTAPVYEVPNMLPPFNNFMLNNGAGGNIEMEDKKSGNFNANITTANNTGITKKRGNPCVFDTRYTGNGSDNAHMNVRAQPLPSPTAYPTNVQPEYLNNVRPQTPMFMYPRYAQHGGGDFLLPLGQVQSAQYMYPQPLEYTSQQYGYPLGYSIFQQFNPPPPPRLVNQMALPPQHIQALSNSHNQMPPQNYSAPILPTYQNYTGLQPSGPGCLQQLPVSSQIMDQSQSVPPPGFGPKNLQNKPVPGSEILKAQMVNSLGISFASGAEDDNFLRKILDAFAAARPDSNPLAKVLRSRNNTNEQEQDPRLPHVESNSSSTVTNAEENQQKTDVPDEHKSSEYLNSNANAGRGADDHLLLPPDSPTDELQVGDYNKRQSENVFPTVKPRYPSLFSTFRSRPNAVKSSKEGKFFAQLNLSEQLEEFILAQSLSPQEMARRRQVIEDLAELMQKEYYSCRIYPFGSFLTGLGDSTSDLDVYLDAFNVNGGGQQSHSFLGVLNSCAKQLRTAKTADNKWVCRRVHPIRTAKVPIVEFTHANGVNCDVSFDNMLALRNSKLIALYIGLHPCVKPLLILVRYWAKFHLVSGSMLLKNYCLVLMVLVFLGKRDILPSVTKLRWLVTENGKRENTEWNADIYDGWDSSFCDDIDRINNIFPSALEHYWFYENKKADIVFLLFRDFCEFYSNFNPSKDVICTLEMDVVPKKFFLAGKDHQLPDCFNSFKIWGKKTKNRAIFKLNTPLCVQDPFCLSYNVAGLTNGKTLFQFQLACHQTFKRINDPKGIISVLDVFVNLPPELKDRRSKFLEQYYRAVKTAQLREEIEGFLLHGRHFLKLLENELPHSDNKVALHKLCPEEILEQKNKRGGPKHSCFETLRPPKKYLNLFSKLFSSYYETSYAKSGERQIQDIDRKARLFWLKAAEEFLSVFWSKCFALNVVKDQCVRRDFGLETNMEEDDDDENEVNHHNTDHEDQAGSDDKENGNEISSLSCPMPPKLIGGFTNLRKEENVVKKLKEIEESEQAIVFMRLKCSTSSTVWELRDTIMESLQKEREPSSSVNVESSKVTKGPRKQNKKPQPPFEEMYQSDPMEIQNKVTQIILNQGPIQQDEHGRTVPILGFNVLIKFDKRWIYENPAIFLIFEKDPSVPCNHVYNEAVASVIQVMQNVFSNYIFHSLLKWVDNGALAIKPKRTTKNENKTVSTSLYQPKQVAPNFAIDLQQFPSLI